MNYLITMPLFLKTNMKNYFFTERRKCAKESKYQSSIVASFVSFPVWWQFQNFYCSIVRVTLPVACSLAQLVYNKMYIAKEVKFPYQYLDLMRN